MNWEAFFALLKRYPWWTLTGVVAIFTTGITVGTWLLSVDQCCAQQQADHKSIEQIQKIVQAQAAKAEADEKAEKAKWMFIRQACILKKLDDPEKCAEAEARSSQSDE